MATLFSNSMARPSYVKFDSDQSNTFRATDIGGLGARPNACGSVSPQDTQRWGRAFSVPRCDLVETVYARGACNLFTRLLVEENSWEEQEAHDGEGLDVFPTPWLPWLLSGAKYAYRSGRGLLPNSRLQRVNKLRARPDAKLSDCTEPARSFSFCAGKQLTSRKETQNGYRGL